jgi:polysaccharide pyruvyl transferase WcaK-like protein
MSHLVGRTLGTENRGPSTTGTLVLWTAGGSAHDAIGKVEVISVTATPKVGLVGFYGHGNFGDELMAVIIARYLANIGVPFSVYRLCPPYAQKYNLPVAHSAEELLEDARVLLWGGGGLLVPWSRLAYTALFPKAGTQFERLISMALRRKMRLLGTSVGGDGTSPRQLIPAYKQRFAESAEYLTVRNPQDLQLLKQFGLKGEFFPDIVWQTGKWFPLRREKTGRMRIGMDIYASNLLRQNAAYLIPSLLAVTRARRDCEFVFIDTTNRTIKPYRGLGLVIRGVNIRTHQFHEMENDLELLGSLDLLVSTRLHAPMICLQCGVPALSLFAEKKTILMFRNLGLERLCYGKGRVGEFLALMRDKEKMERFIREFRFPDVVSLRAESDGHLQVLRARLCGGQMQ